MAGEPASVVVERRVEWADTDASGHYHNTFVARLLEVAEGVLYRRLGLERLMGSIPRVRYEASYRRRLWYGDVVEGRLRVLSVGRTSLTFIFDVVCDGELAADARCVVVHAAPDADQAEPWPDEVRAVLLGAGPQAPERLARG